MLLQQCLPFTVLKPTPVNISAAGATSVATVLTVYGIETSTIYYHADNSWCWLQQCLPFTVLKRTCSNTKCAYISSCNSAYRLRY